jgi:hypothetical protein
LLMKWREGRSRCGSLLLTEDRDGRSRGSGEGLRSWIEARVGSSSGAYEW